MLVPGQKLRSILVGHINDGKGVLVVVEADFMSLVLCIRSTSNAQFRIKERKKKKAYVSTRKQHSFLGSGTAPVDDTFGIMGVAISSIAT